MKQDSALATTDAQISALEMLAREIEAERRILRLAVDRLDALRSLETFARTLCARHNRSVTFTELFDLTADYVELAHLEALAERILQDEGSTS